MKEFFVGGPSSFGLDVASYEDAQKWIATTPPGTDPREFMTPEETALFNTHIPHVLEYPDDDQFQYITLAKVSGLAVADQTAGYEAL